MIGHRNLAPRRVRALAAAAFSLGLAGSLAAPAHADGTIRMWTFLNPDGTSGREQALKQMIGAFEASHPGVAVQVEQQVWDQMTPKFLAAHASGSAPDVIWVHSEMLGGVLDAGALGPIAALAAADADLANSLYASATVDGAQYGVGHSYTIMGIHARADWLKEAGIAPDSIKTWADLEDAAARLTVRNGDTVERWGFCQHFGMAKVDPGILLASMLAGETPAFAPDGTATWATPEAVAGLERSVKLIRDGVSPPDAANWNNDDMYDQFAAGRCAMATGTAVRVPKMQEAVGAENVAFLPYPSDDPSRPSPQVMNAWIVGVWSGSEVADLAGEFVAALSSPESDRLWVTVGGAVPVRGSTAGAVGDFFDDPANQYLRSAMEYIRSGGWVAPIGADVGGYRDDMNRAVQSVLINGTDPGAALEEAEAAYNARHGYAR